MRLTERDRRVVADVLDFRVITRQQLQALSHFHSKTRANAALLRLTRFGYLSRRYQPSVAGTQRALYLPGPQAADLLGQPSERIKRERIRIKVLSDLFLEHQLLINDVRLAFQGSQSVLVERWLNDSQLRALRLGIIPDGYAEYTQGGRRFAAFLELDRGTESLERWAMKVRGYLQLATSGRHREILSRQYFRVLVVVPSLDRLSNLRKTTSQATTRMFWFVELNRLLVEGPFSQIWLLPEGADRHELTEP